jgi:hypothetical protein
MFLRGAVALLAKTWVKKAARERLRRSLAVELLVRTVTAQVVFSLVLWRR